ncbi:hypothetical protein PRZ48_006763 [Zasmidium cellare]|uniref:Uncharacterized protein n=1 Tax=Zasmidium cellare TaxID=395010 RepID=A0ABR0EHG7_ZASCE|nr:hypothetical protein PRZ48_006763 [Zasmidium cellare]
MLFWSQEKARYQPLDSEGERWQRQQNTRENWSRRYGWAITSLLLLANLLIIPPMVYKVWQAQQPPQPVIKPCGSSWQEAAAKGCQYDVMMNEWLPPSCFDAELTAEFKNITQWPFWTDESATQQLSEEELSRRTELTWTTVEYHYTHCVFTWIKLQRAIEQQRDIESSIAKMAHTQHCKALMLGKMEELDTAILYPTNDTLSMKDLGTLLEVGFPTCINARSMY